MRKRHLSLIILLIGGVLFSPYLVAAAKPSSSAQRGKLLYEANECAACHLIGTQGCKDGVRLDRLPQSHDRKFIIGQLRDPEAHVKQHGAPFVGDPSLMPNPRLSPQEIQLIADYIMSVQPKSKPAKAPKIIRKDDSTKPSNHAKS